MANKRKSKQRSKRENQDHLISTKSNNRRSWKTIGIAIYLCFILLSAIPYLADQTIEPNMKDSYEYHLTYKQDGRQSHYYVERVNTSYSGKIDLTYVTTSNSLVVESSNLKILHIYCRSMYEDECKKVFGFDPKENSNYYKWYFIEKNHLNVNLDADHEIEELKFIDTPIPYKVVVNGKEWLEGENYNYTENFSTAISNVPEGFSSIDIYFKSETGIPPVAVLDASRTLGAVNQTISFDASSSFDTDGTIITHLIDFGDGRFWSGTKASHQYSEPGVYGVILMVRDNDDLVDHAYINITIAESSDIPKIQGIIPNQIKPEDSPPWSLNLDEYTPIPNKIDLDFYWYLTGENTSMYKVSGENDTNNRLIFTPEPDVYSNDLVTLWLVSTENLTASQLLWINITPVNDAPTIYGIPDLIIHYEEPYTFNYEPYINDKETPLDELVLNVDDGYEVNFVTIDRLNITYTYPHSLLGETIYATISVSDGNQSSHDVIAITITSNYVPRVVNSLPDLWIYEGTTKYNVFDLDDYFTDPDDDSIFFTYGFSHLEIYINENHTVDITASSEWTGNDLVTFRAHDPIGAIAEDIIIVTIIPMNDPPYINGVPDLYVHYDHDYRFELTPFVSDNDNSTDELKIIPSDKEHIKTDQINNLVIILNYPKRFLGQTLTLRLTVSDGLETGFQDLTVTITEDYPPELVKNIPDFILLEDEPLLNAFNLNNYFIDLDGDALFYTSGNQQVNITIHNNRSVDISSPPNWFGSELIYFRATDPIGALQQDLVLITVLPVNDPPVFFEIPPQYGNLSKRWELDMEPYIVDVDNNISELTIFLDNEFIIVSGRTLIFFGSPKLPKEIQITVSDGDLSTTDTIEIHLNRGKPEKIITLWDLFISILPFLIIIIFLVLIIAGVFRYRRNKFNVEEVFLIHQGGTLITHLSNNPQANVDDIIFSGMFTAVQEFIQDTFSSDDDQDNTTKSQNWALDELKFGENNILIERSENTYLAVIFSGPGAKKLRKIVNILLEKIETKYQSILPAWDGNVSKLKDTKNILSALIPTDEEKENTTDLELNPKQIDTKDVKLEPTLTKPISSTVAIKKPIRSPVSKDFLRNDNEPMINQIPGLTTLPLNIHKRNDRMRALSNLDLNNLPISFQFKTRPMLTKTYVIKRGIILLETNTQSNNKSTNNEIKKQKQSRKVLISKHNKKVEIDTSRSLFEQLAEMDNKD
jgi:hypothetical protein